MSSCTFKENVKSHDPLVPSDVSIIVSVKVFEDPVHQDVIGHVEAGMKELSEQFSVHVPLLAAVCLLWLNNCRCILK